MASTPGADRPSRREQFASSLAGATAAVSSRLTGFYRRPPGLPVLLALLLVPLLLAGIGALIGGGGAAADAPAASTTPTGQAAAEGPATNAVEVGQDGSRLVVRGRVPDAAAEKALLDSVRAGAGDRKVVDEVSVEPGAAVPALSGIGTVTNAARGVEGFGLRVDDRTVTLRGTAPDQAAAGAVAFAAGQSFPGHRLASELGVTGGPAPAATTAAAPVGPLDCNDVNTGLAARLKARPVQFGVGGSTVTGESQAQLSSLGKELAACTFTAAEVGGHSDGTGPAAGNLKLSQSRAEAVRAVLVAAGVPGDKVTAKGYGSTKPVADDATEAGRVLNRRVEITVQ